VKEGDVTDLDSVDEREGLGSGSAAPNIRGGLLDPSTFPTDWSDEYRSDASAIPAQEPALSGQLNREVHAEVLQDILAAQAKLSPLTRPQAEESLLPPEPSLDRPTPSMIGPLDTDTHAEVLRDILSAHAQLPQVSARSVYSLGGGVVSGVGWQHPDNHGAGMGWRVYVTEPDGSRTGYGHMDPASTPRRGQRVQPGDLLGQYASPTNGRSTGPHVHVQRYDPRGNIVDPGQISPLHGPSIMGTRFNETDREHPYPHQGTDWRAR
jgi:murein DD-endopeptidase MepM/ murein hydrolase activator NlpD